VKAFHICLPPRDEQKRICDVLQLLDDKIEQNRRTAAKLEGLARATFRTWFVDFAPVRAKAGGATSYPGLPPAAFSALPTTFTDSPLGPIPEGWEAKPLKEVVKLTMGQSPSSEFYNESGEGLPFHQGVSDHGFRFPSRRVYCTVEGRMAGAGDVLLSVRAPVGRINVADTHMVLGRGLAGMRHKHGHQSFLLYLMQHHFAEDDAVGDGTIYKAVNKDFLEAMSLITADPRVEAAFEQVSAPMDALILSLTRESDRLAALRDYLLPRLLSGAVRVRSTSDVGGGA
jgi:type I restriction enzyme S subunit